VMVTSGGTTGSPKLSCRSFAEWLAMVDLGPQPRRRQLICTSLAYIAQVHLDQTLVGGGMAVLRERFDPAEVLATIERERISHLGLLEPKLDGLAHHPDLGHRDLSSLVAIAHIGADAAPALRRRWLERLGPVLLHPYGTSEVAIISLLAPGDYSLEHPELLDSAGRVMPGVEVRIVGGDRAGGGDGRIQVRSAVVAPRFRAARPYAPTAAGWFDTGDVGSLDERGYLRVRGRATDAVPTATGAVFPVDLQEALCAMPEVGYAVAVRAEDPTAGFDVAVTPRPPATPTLAALRERLDRRLGGAAPPIRLAIVEAIPLTEQGKPDRRALRRMVATTT
jgi:fatty-acyl-CoA synthase